MISYEEALSHIKAESCFWTPRITKMPLLQCVGFVATHSVFARENIPAADVSAMDGFAVNHSQANDCAETTTLPISGLLTAGQDVRALPQNGNYAAEIMTGALLPGPPFDSVIRYEDALVETNTNGQSSLKSTAPVLPFQNVRRAGSDIKLGDKVVGAGSAISLQEVMLCAATGVSEIEVYCKPKLAVICTGDEIVEFQTESISPHQTRNSSAAYLRALCTQLGIEVEYVGISKDTPHAFAVALQTAKETNCDAILTTGAVSAGQKDHLPEVLQALGGEIIFHKVAIRPGKPMLFANWKKVPVFGMPGNPLSTAVGFRFFVLPFFQRAVKGKSSILAYVSTSYRKPRNLTSFFLGRLSAKDGSLFVKLFSQQSSHMTSTFAQANTWVVDPAPNESIEQGNLVTCFPMFGTELDAIGEQQ